MGYYEVLKNMIDGSGLSHKEIAEICKINGHKVDPSYISKLVNRKLAPASELMNTNLAKACNHNPELLIIEAYIYKAPDIIKRLLSNIQQKYDYTSISSSENERSLSHFIVDFNSEILSIENTITGLQIKNEMMKPLINNGDQIIIENFAVTPEPVLVSLYEGRYPEPIIDKETFEEIYTDKIGFTTHAKRGDIVCGWDLESEEIIIGYYSGIKYVDNEEPSFSISTLNWECKNYEYGITDVCYNLVSYNNNDTMVNIELSDAYNKANTIVFPQDVFDSKNETRTYTIANGLCILGKVSKVISKI